MNYLIFLLFGWGVSVFSQVLFLTQPPANITHEIVTFDKSAVEKAAVHLSRKLLGLSIEFCYITTYLGDVNKPNSFSYQLLQNIQDRAGHPPRIRIGGNTQDRAKYCDSCLQTLNNTFIAGNSEAINVTFNRHIFTVLNENVPNEQEYTFGLNLGQDNVEIPLAEIAAAQRYMNVSRLIGYELGNEPDFYYTSSGMRGSSWNVFAYVQQTVAFLSQLTASVTGPSAPSAKKFPGYMYGSMFPDSFSIGTLLKLGVSKMVEDIKIFNLHCYFGDVCTPEDAALVSLPILLNHFSNIRVVEAYKPAIAAAKSVGAKFYIGETNSAACHGLPGVSDTLGAALWMLDYSLTGATMGIDGLNFHNGLNFSYSAWDPVPISGKAPRAKGMYYGYLFVADLVADLHQPLISPIYSLDAENMAHFAIYSPSLELKKMVILNLDYFNSTAGRAYKTFDVTSIFGEKINVTRLTGPDSVAQEGLTWAGQTVDGQGRIVGTKVVETVTNGNVTIGSSEGVIIEMA